MLREGPDGGNGGQGGKAAAGRAPGAGRKKRPETAMKKVYNALKRFTLAFAALAVAIFVYLYVRCDGGCGGSGWMDVSGRTNRCVHAGRTTDTRPFSPTTTTGRYTCR